MAVAAAVVVCDHVSLFLAIWRVFSDGVVVGARIVIDFLPCIMPLGSLGVVCTPCRWSYLSPALVCRKRIVGFTAFGKFGIVWFGIRTWFRRVGCWFAPCDWFGVRF
ncbi:hypothetical protein BS50DRAFT_568812 [Corynespora cassiicola Philippines]|uniref:Uncharacterized protein n=1 Tax=Corynespora cassiicola Philippines TaxID=1448308 RepID=A0A2T2P6M1_CORCC|nr:hypothetical protein BS50DRAFT_568812 [Corynespora cassiicola Philippines]